MWVAKKACRYIRQVMFWLILLMLIAGCICYAEYMLIVSGMYISIYTIASGIYFAIPEQKR